MQENGVLVYSRRECKLVQTLQNNTVVSQKTKKLPYDLATPLLGVHLTKMKTVIEKRYMHPNVHSNTIYSCQDTEQPKRP